MDASGVDDRFTVPTGRAGLGVIWDARGRTRLLAIVPDARTVTQEPGAWLGQRQVIVCAPGHPVEGPRSEASQRLGLTRLEERTVRALVATGDLRRAAASAGVGYETARKVAKAAFTKAGVRGQGELVTLWMPLDALGETLDGPVDRPLSRLFDLTQRQARIADLVGRGLERGEAAWRLGISIHVVKAELKVVFEACGVRTQTALAALTAEIRVLEAVVTAHEGWTSARIAA